MADLTNAYKHTLTMRPMFVAHVGVCASGRCECGEDFFGPMRGETYRNPTEVANAWSNHLQATWQANRRGSEAPRG